MMTCVGVKMKTKSGYTNTQAHWQYVACIATKEQAYSTTGMQKQFTSDDIFYLLFAQQLFASLQQ